MAGLIRSQSLITVSGDGERLIRPAQVQALSGMR